MFKRILVLIFLFFESLYKIVKKKLTIVSLPLILEIKIIYIPLPVSIELVLINLSKSINPKQENIVTINKNCFQNL